MGSALGDGSLAVSPPLVPGATFDRSLWAASVTTQADELRAALDAVKSQEVAAKQTLARKQAAMDAHDANLRTVISTMTAWWTLTDMTELVDKLESDLRPRQPGEPESDAPEPTVEPEPPVTGPVVSASGS